MFLVKKDSGLFVPAYNRDKELANKIGIGEEIYATKARNPEFHRKTMALFQLGFQAQDTETEFEVYRKKTEMKAGFVIWTKDKNGNDFPLPKSISFEKMDELEFQSLYKAVREIISIEAKIAGAAIDAELENFY